MLRITLFLSFILTLSTASAQMPFNPKQHTPANPLLIQNFLGSRCLDTSSWQQPFQFPQMIRLSLQDLYAADAGVSHQHPTPPAGTKLQLGTPKNTYPFAVFFSSSSQDTALYLIFKGFCRGHHISVPITWSGHYHIAILDQQKPSLFTINTTTSPATIQYRKACAIDLSSSINKKPQAPPKNPLFFGRRAIGGEELLEDFLLPHLVHTNQHKR
ncbi:MAG: hypothetical protein R2828_30045 [Saprospiraceae bacterium]